MRIFIAISCCLVLLSSRAWIIGICYSLCRKLSSRVNTEFIVKTTPRLLFAIFKQYAGFKFEGDYSLIHTLPEQYLIISNHQSLLDIVVHMNYYNGTRLRFIAKKELGNHVPLVSQAMKAVDKFALYARENNIIPVIFPEGSRSKNGELGTFNAAGFRRFLNNAPMPVAVCALDGGWQISSIRKIIQNLKGGSYKIKLLKVYEAPTTKEEQLKILEEGKTLIGEQLRKWRTAAK